MDSKKYCINTKTLSLGVVKILIPLKNSDDYYEAIFFQIGLNKTKSEIIRLINDISINDNKYKKGIEKYLNITIKDIYINFIFDKETQENNIEMGDKSCGSNYCLSNNIIFYLFSLEDYKLYKLNESMIYEQISIYEYKIENKNILGNKRKKLLMPLVNDIYDILDENEKNQLIKLKPNIKYIKRYLKSDIYINILQNKKLYKNHLYIFIDHSFNKLFGIDGKLKIFKDGNFKDSNVNFSLNKKLRMYDINI